MAFRVLGWLDLTPWSGQLDLGAIREQGRDDPTPLRLRRRDSAPM